jgi:hypothetical protein
MVGEKVFNFSVIGNEVTDVGDFPVNIIRPDLK